MTLPVPLSVACFFRAGWVSKALANDILVLQVVLAFFRHDWSTTTFWTVFPTDASGDDKSAVVAGTVCDGGGVSATMVLAPLFFFLPPFSRGLDGDFVHPAHCNNRKHVLQCVAILDQTESPIIKK
jgi:hypothetical protein